MNENLKLFGIIAKTHGYNGELLCRIEGYTTDLMGGELHWIFIKRHGEKVPYRVTEINISDNRKFILALKNINNEKEALKLVGCNFYLLNENVIFDKVNELIDSGLIGWKAYNNETFIGEVIDYYDNKSQVLLSIRNLKKQFLLPLVDELILKIDNKNQILFLDLPEGLDSL